MKRIFQHNQGRIPELEGRKVGNAKLLVNQEDSSVVVLWLYLLKSDTWYRVFLDGVYCGIDEYQGDESHGDLDEGRKIEDISSHFCNTGLISVYVEDKPSENRLSLILQAENQSFHLDYDTASDYCRFKRA